jgi:hypothetical protein
MNTIATDAALDQHRAATGAKLKSAVIRARAGLYLGAAASTVLGAIMLFAKSSSGDTYHHAADYWITALGIPYMLAPLLFLPALHKLNRGRDGRLGLAGLAISRVGLLTFLPLLTYSLIVGADRSFGPTYILATLATFVGLALFTTGTFRAKMLPPWIPHSG